MKNYYIYIFEIIIVGLLLDGIRHIFSGFQHWRYFLSKEI